MTEAVLVGAKMHVFMENEQKLIASELSSTTSDTELRIGVCFVLSAARRSGTHDSYCFSSRGSINV